MQPNESAMKSNDIYDLIGIGIGPFNLSLAALIFPIEQLKFKFLDDKPSFYWHPELMFRDASMQTSYLKDLVTPVDPTSSFSFLNYLVQKGQLYHFINTDRKSVSRIEFQDYCLWVSESLAAYLEFNQPVEEVRFDNGAFRIRTRNKTHLAKNICIASGPVRNIPECARDQLGKKVFHAKSTELKELDISGKRVLVVGGGQTGVEVFKNILDQNFGVANYVKLISGRENLVGLEESPFTNDVFTPDFVENFHSQPQKSKDSFTQKLLFASDGNTPEYLNELYRSLYMDRYYLEKFSPYNISPMRWMTKIQRNSAGYIVTIENKLTGKCAEEYFDNIILATGFKTALPSYLGDLISQIGKDELNRPKISKDYRLDWGDGKNSIYAMNYGRHMHGIADPQTSLMSWRSSVIINSLLGEEYYKAKVGRESFLDFFKE